MKILIIGEFGSEAEKVAEFLSSEYSAKVAKFSSTQTYPSNHVCEYIERSFDDDASYCIKYLPVEEAERSDVVLVPNPQTLFQILCNAKDEEFIVYYIKCSSIARQIASGLTRGYKLMESMYLALEHKQQYRWFISEAFRDDWLSGTSCVRAYAEIESTYVKDWYKDVASTIHSVYVHAINCKQ